MGVPVCDHEPLVRVLTGALVHLPDGSGNLLGADGFEAPVERYPEVLGGNGVSVSLQAFALAVDGTEALAGDFRSAGPVPAFGVRTEDEDDVFSGNDGTGVVIDHVLRICSFLTRYRSFSC